MQGVAVADFVWQDAGAVCDLGHGQAYEVVGDSEPPEFLRDAFGVLAPQGGFFTFEGVGLDFIVGEFEFPAFVVERPDFGGGEGDRIEQRGEQGLGPEAFALIPDGADGEGLR